MEAVGAAGADLAELAVRSSGNELAGADLHGHTELLHLGGEPCFAARPASPSSGRALACLPVGGWADASRAAASDADGSGTDPAGHP